MSSSLLSKNIQIKIQRTVILPLVLYGRGTRFLTLRKECRQRVFENRMLRRIFEPKRRHNGSEENYIMRRLIICTPHQTLFR